METIHTVHWKTPLHDATILLLILSTNAWRKGMRIALLIAGAVSSVIAITVVSAQSESNDGSASTTKRYLPEYTESGDLILPKNYNKWVFVGSPLTPNALNDGRPISPNFIMSISNRAHTISTRRRASSPRERSSSRNYNLHSQPKTRMAHASKPRDEAFSRKAERRRRYG